MSTRVPAISTSRQTRASWARAADWSRALREQVDEPDPILPHHAGCFGDQPIFLRNVRCARAAQEVECGKLLRPSPLTRALACGTRAVRLLANTRHRIRLGPDEPDDAEK